MGGIIGSVAGGLFGGKKSKESSQNVALPWLKDTYGGMAQQGTNAFTMAQGGLGVGGDPAASGKAYESYKKSTGYDQLMKDAMGAVSGKFGALGLGNSGAATKEAQRQAVGIGQQNFGGWLDRLMGSSQQGLGAGGLIGQAGQTSSKTSSEKPGLTKLVGGLLT